jgi:cyclase
MKKYKKIVKWLGFVLLIAAAIGGSLYFIYIRPFIEKMKLTEIIKFDESLTIVIGGGGNSGILTSDSLILIIDTKMDEAAKKLYEQTKLLAGNTPILVVNTHFHPDHIGGNELYVNSKIIAGGNYSQEIWIKEADKKSLPNTWLKDRLTFKMGDETVTILNFGKDVHTQSDVVVYLHNRKLLFAGDVILNKQAPVLMGKANPEGYLWAFDWLSKNFDIQKVVPGHGAVDGIEIITHYRQYFMDMKLAANNKDEREKLIAKYKDWGQLPFFMSPEATIKAFKKSN